MMTTKLKIRIYGDPCLRRVSEELKNVGSSERMLIKAMIETMHEHKGVGLAAPQVGINEQIFVADVGEGPLVFINPRIVKESGSATLEEGCLSIPGVVVNVERPESIVIQYINENNKEAELECHELLARVIQHETDHLFGKLIVDYASQEEKAKIEEQLKLIDNQTEAE